LLLVLRALGAESIARGTHVRLRITSTDLLTLDVHANVIARIDDIAAADAGAEKADTNEDAAEGAGPLTLAIDMQSDEAADAGAQPSQTPA